MKRILSLSGALTALLFSALPASAAFVTIAVQDSDVANAAPSSTPIGAVIGFIVGAAVVFGIIAALLFIIIGAFQWITSGGDKAKVETARNHIVTAIVGLIIIFLSLVIVNFALQILGIGSLSNLKIKTLLPCAQSDRNPDGSCRTNGVGAQNPGQQGNY